MKVNITWRCHEGDDPKGEIEVPNDTGDFLLWVNKYGRFDPVPPGGNKQTHRGHPELWTLDFQNDYD